jgi:protein-S-isoprenylcysteine O-methyltransferase Ste14
MRPIDLFAIFWIAFALSWLLAAFWRSTPTLTLPAASRRVMLYRVLLVLGGVLLNVFASHKLHAHRLWPIGRESATILACLTLPGFAFAWWARLHLGALWSGAVTKKPDHHVVDTGPYRLVRHPIYTGILFACLVSALAVGTWVALLGFALIVAGFWVKARLEEGFLATELDPGAYLAYRARVPMLVPFWPIRG